MTTFMDASVEAVRSFLQTVVVVDNRAGFEVVEEDIGEPLLVPDSFAFASAEQVPVEAVPGRILDGPLDATALSRAFACQGLICAILKPSIEDRMEDPVDQAAARSDMLVLDWQMDDDGELASAIVDRVLDTDGDEGRLRLVAIYTSRSPLRDVAASLAKRVDRLTLSTDGLGLSWRDTRIVLLSKGKAANAPEEDHLAVEVGDLPERLLREFASCASGLLSNATMATIGGIRDHTHRMLARFGSEMDGPLLTHRTLLASSEEADEFAGALILGELQAQVPWRRILTKHLGKDRVGQYVQEVFNRGFQPKLALTNGEAPVMFDLDEPVTSTLVEVGMPSLDGVMKAMSKKATQKDGPEDVQKFRKSLREKLPMRLYALFADRAAGVRNHDEFAVRAKVSRDAQSAPSDFIPSLRLGTVVEFGADVLVCLTPPCDAIRIPQAGGTFLFAELCPAETSFDLVIPRGGGYARLTLERKRTRLVSISFAPDEGGDVVATRNLGRVVFAALPDAIGPARPVEWLADLKPMHAQRLVQSWASNLARVGVDDFEWHRFQMPPGAAG